MKVLLNFKCKCGLEHRDKWLESNTKEIDCECGSKATKQLSAPRSFGNTTGKSPSSNYKR